MSKITHLVIEQHPLPADNFSGIKDKGDTEYLHCLQCRQNTKPNTRNEKDGKLYAIITVIFIQLRHANLNIAGVVTRKYTREKAKT